MSCLTRELISRGAASRTCWIRCTGALFGELFLDLIALTFFGNDRISLHAIHYERRLPRVVTVLVGAEGEGVVHDLVEELGQPVVGAGVDDMPSK